jgi:hypothetical protein
MSPPDPLDQHLGRLRVWRNRPERDLSLGFLKQQFQKEVERPHKQLGALAIAWGELVPPELAEHARLEGLSRGVLRVAVDDSAHLYELDRILRQGLERQLRNHPAGRTLRRVQLHITDGPPPRRRAPQSELGD